MTWIKKMMNRIFDADKNEEYEENLIDIELEEHEEEVQIEKPAFRFPIITDAEIYGWEPDPENERRKADNLITELHDDGFEPVPLYKNERWPGGNEKPTIHRATAPLKYQKKHELEPEAIPRLAPKKDSVPAEEDKEKSSSAIIRKRSSRPFTPTEVVSPIYGYSRPDVKKFRAMLDESDTGTKKNTDLTHTDSTFDQNDANFTNGQIVAEEEINRIDSVDHAHTYEKEEVLKSDHPADQSFAEPDEPENEMGMRDGQLPVMDERHLVHVEEVVEEEHFEAESFESAVDQVEETITVGMDGHLGELHESEAEEQHQPGLDSELTAKEEVEVDPQPIIEEFKYEQTPEASEEGELTYDRSSETSEEKSPTVHAPETRIEDASDPVRSPVQKKEKIVPFNVLMLKNDKLKYEEREKRVNSKPLLESKPIDVETAAAVQTEPEHVLDAHQEELEDQPYYAFPPKEFLIQPEEHIEDSEWLQSQSEKLEEALSYFAVQANVIEAVQGPTVTRFELTVGHGTKVSKVRNLTDDLKLALAAEDIRIQAPIPGTSSIGIEIPNRKPRAVRISEVIETKRFQDSESPLEAVLGLSLTGEPVTLDLRKMPHGMIAGATGSGKSVCINSILISLLYKASPADLKMLLIDPKMVELAPFNGIPHLLSPVITDVKAATAALKWAVGEMERRYELFAHVGARNIERYNEMAEKDRKFSLKMPYLLIVIDELADLMMMAPADVEVSISRITQKARACGIHLIIATQRPSVDVITGTIKANVPTRIAFSVSSQIDSRTIIDTPGAERLLGKGDMLYLGNGQSSAMRLQGTFVTDAEIERIIEHVQNEAEPDYLFGQEDLLANTMEEEESDPLFANACKFIIEQGSASTSLLQRNFSIGYNRAAKLMDRMEKLGFISEQRGSKAREVYLTESELNHFLNGNEKPVEL
ncbi:DNA translocase FtsK [Sporosarcina sp. Marseille-Q4943]|uniref:DNA translocase FtsK n=1 Tax=Sporosarcina sp. Marseille-Q4943 TaxID=2942204 RepID=UPI00208DA611|nr:DNA translocase FtsK [Sporosarcina sp. Marseille-Q4943]